MGTLRRRSLVGHIGARLDEEDALFLSSCTVAQLKQLLVELDRASKKAQMVELQKLRTDERTSGLAKTLNRPKIAVPA